MKERLTFNYGTAAQAVVAQELAVRPPPPPAAATRPLVERGPDWAYRGLIAFTVILFFRPQDHVPALSVLHLAELAALVALGGMAVRRLKLHLPVAPALPEVGGVVAIGLLMLVTIPFSIWIGGALGVFRDMYLKVLLIFILMLHALATPRRLEQFTWVILTACAYLSARALFDYVRGVNLIEDGRVQGAIGGIFRNPNDLALNLVSFLPFALFLAAGRGPALRRALAGLMTLLMLGAIVCTRSRSGAVGLGVVGLLILARLAIRRPAIVGGVLLVGVFAIPFVPEAYWQRIASISDERVDTSGSREARSILLREAWQAFLDRPFTGVGAGQFRNYNPEGRREPWRETHNVLLQLAADLGVFGPLLLLFLWIRGLAAVRRGRQMLGRLARHPDRAALPLARDEARTLDVQLSAAGTALVGWFVCAQFASVGYSWTFYYVLALAVVPREILRARLAPALAPVRVRAAWRLPGDPHAQPEGARA